MQFNNHLTPGIVKEKVLMAVVNEHRHHQKSGIMNQNLFETQNYHLRPEQYLEGKSRLNSEKKEKESYFLV